VCHLVLFLPVLALPVFWLMPPAEAIAVYAPVLGLSAWVYYVTVRAMRQPVLGGHEEMLNAVGTVIQAEHGRALVRLHGELWHALAPGDVTAGDSVTVVGLDGLVLRVKRQDKSPAAAVRPDPVS
jgi:inner membrane protein